MSGLAGLLGLAGGADALGGGLSGMAQRMHADEQRRQATALQLMLAGYNPVQPTPTAQGHPLAAGSYAHGASDVLNDLRVNPVPERYKELGPQYQENSTPSPQAPQAPGSALSSLVAPRQLDVPGVGAFEQSPQSALRDSLGIQQSQAGLARNQAQTRLADAQADALAHPTRNPLTVSHVVGTGPNAGKPVTRLIDPVTHGAVGEELEAQPTDNTLVPVQRPDGSIVYTPRADAAGKNAPSPNGSGSAAIQKLIAANKTKLGILDDAEREIAGHPQAVGLERGAGELVSSLPLVGGALAAVQDAANQRLDPGGVNARASLANIGSMVIHDRSGAAVTVSEYPRLKPFIPTSSDTPEAIRDKIGKLRRFIQQETDLLSAGRGAAPTADTSGSSTPSYEEWKRQNGIP